MELLQDEKIISINYVKNTIVNDFTATLIKKLNAFKNLNVKSKLSLFCSPLNTINIFFLERTL